MPTIGSATPVQFAAGSFLPTSCRRLPHSGTSLSIPWHKFWRLANGTCKRKRLSKNGVKASAEQPDEAALGPIKKNAKPSHYHPFEDIIESELLKGEDARLTPAESSRTIIEVNNKATLMFSNLVNDEVRENIFLPDLPYATDEYGNIYFQVKNNEDILPTLAAEENLVQVIIGLDTTELLREMDSLGSSDFGINIEELNDDDGDIDDEDNDDNEDEEDGSDDSDLISDVEDEEDVEDLNASLGEWAKLETMRSFHPMYFANKMVEAVSDDPINYMDQPPAGLIVQGLLRPALLEDYTFIQKHMSESNPKYDNSESNHIGREAEDKVGDLGTINGDTHRQMPSQDTTAKPGNTEIDNSLNYGTSFYKLEMMKIQLISAHGTQTDVEVEDFRKATPDAIAHSSANIISRLKAGGEKTLQALMSLCWRCKGIQVEEASVIGIDTLGFDLRICSGKQVQTLRFAFNARASSEYSAERQLNDLLFPRTHPKLEKKKETQQTKL